MRGMRGMNTGPGEPCGASRAAGDARAGAQFSISERLPARRAGGLAATRRPARSVAPGPRDDIS